MQKGKNCKKYIILVKKTHKNNIFILYHVIFLETLVSFSSKSLRDLIWYISLTLQN